ncbi:MAG: hypothetical protein AAF799_34510 [Myxococcota bacterium]
MDTTEPTTLAKLTGVYHADGSLLGELRYVFGKLRGTAHCALCDITHGSVRKKRSFRDLEQALAVPLELVHLDERSPEIAAFTEGRTPAVVGHTDAGLVMLLGADQLELDGEVPRFHEALDQAVQTAGLRWPEPRA